MRTCIFAALLLVTLRPTHAATITFDNGAGNNRWSNATNWSPNVLPSSTDTARVISNRTATIDQAGAVANDLDVQLGGHLNIAVGGLTYGYQNNRRILVGGGSGGDVVQSGGLVTSNSGNGDVLVGALGRYTLSGGTLNVGDDLIVQNGGEFRIVGSPVLQIGDDLVNNLGSNALITIVLTGNTLPTINIADRLILNSNISLAIQTTQWMGGQDISLFNVRGQIDGDFNQVTVDGVIVSPSQYSIGSGAVTFAVPEPMNQLWLTVIGVGFMMRRRHENEKS